MEDQLTPAWQFFWPAKRKFILFQPGFYSCLPTGNK